MALPATWLGVEVISALRRPEPSRVSRDPEEGWEPVPETSPRDPLEGSTPVVPQSDLPGTYEYHLRGVDASGKQRQWALSADRRLSLRELDCFLDKDPDWKGNRGYVTELTFAINLDAKSMQDAPKDYCLYLAGGRETRRVFGSPTSPTRVGRVWHKLSSGGAVVALALSIVGFGGPWCIFLVVRYVARGFEEPPA